jgi:hypothetical protein
MSTNEPEIPFEDPLGRPMSSAAEPHAAGGSRRGVTSPPPPSSRPGGMPMSTDTAPHLPKMRRIISNNKSRRVAVVVLALSVLGVSVGLATSSSATPPSVSAPAQKPVSSADAIGVPASGGGSNARSGPATGGASGTVGNVSATSFTMTTSAGQDVTVEEALSTSYKKGTTSTSAAAVTKGETALVLGTTDSTTITASQVIVQWNGEAPVPSSAAGVVPFQRGAPTTSKQVGQIPASYSEGSGTIVSGTTPNNATEAALAAYPGGIVDRVVKLSNGEFEVHYIGVNWPHHVFVNQDFEVVGAD